MGKKTEKKFDLVCKMSIFVVMVEEIIKLVSDYNNNRVGRGIVVTPRDVAMLILEEVGLSKEVAYYLVNLSGAVSMPALDGEVSRYFKQKWINDMRTDVRGLIHGLSVGGVKVSSGWKDEEIEKLTPEELEKMGTYFLRNASLKSDVDPKEINDLIKMLDSVGALPKKKQDDEKVKQVVLEMPYNSVCKCGREIYDPKVKSYFDDKISEPKKQKK